MLIQTTTAPSILAELIKIFSVYSLFDHLVYFILKKKLEYTKVLDLNTSKSYYIYTGTIILDSITDYNQTLSTPQLILDEQNLLKILHGFKGSRYNRRSFTV